MSICIAVAFVMASSCSSSGGGKASKVNYSGVALSGESDSLAYIVGLSIGEQLMQMDSSINVNAVCRAIVEYSQGRAAMTIEESRTAFMHYKMYVEPERQRGYEERYLADMAAADRSYKRTRSGLTYNIEVIGNEKSVPKLSNDWVTIKYCILRGDGSRIYPRPVVVEVTVDTLGVDTLGVDSLAIDSLVADSLAVDTLAVDTLVADSVAVEVVEAEPEVLWVEESFVLGDLPDGVAEGLRLIGVGGRINLWVPSKLGYGEDGNEEMGIEPIETLFYQVELLAREENKGAERRQEQFEDNF